MSITYVRQIAASNRKEVRRFAKFATVGAAGSVTDFAVLNILVQGFGATLLVANTVSFTAAVIQNFTLNRVWTFPESRARDAGRQLAKFAIVSIIGLGINLAVVMVVHHSMDALWASLLGEDVGFVVSYNFAKLLAIGVVLFWNFFANRLWTYRGL